MFSRINNCFMLKQGCMDKLGFFRMQEVNKHLYVSLYYFSWLCIILTYDLNNDNVISMVKCNPDFWGGGAIFQRAKR